jgi:2Fe-2S ferredoxin
MVKVTYVAFDGGESTVDVDTGMTLMEGAVQNGVEGIEAVCGGNCYCGTCRIYVAAEWREKLVAPREEELDMIEASGEEDTSARLACQIPVTEAMDGIVVKTPEFQK